MTMWIKVCGIRDCETARHLAGIDIDAVGLNFYPRSPRVVDVEMAVQIAELLPATIARVGVFVNHPLREVESITNRCQLDHLQLHGDEPPSYLLELKRRIPQVRLLRAWRMRKDKLSGLRTYLNECQSWNCELAGCLVDAHTPGVYGGSGRKVPWNQLARDYEQANWPPLIMAGGLNPSNIRAAILAVRPWGVDVASGVESSPGVKDLSLIREFVVNARALATED